MIAHWRNHILVTFINTPPCFQHCRQQKSFTTLELSFVRRVLFDWHFTPIYNNRWAQWLSVFKSTDTINWAHCWHEWNEEGEADDSYRDSLEIAQWSWPALLACSPQIQQASFFLSFFFSSTWHKSGRWKCHGAGSFCKEVLIAMRV